MAQNEAGKRAQGLSSPTSIAGNGNSRRAGNGEISGVQRITRALGSLVAYCFSWYRY
ncbi:MAG TPA: hypothetical protein VJQ82_19935 [Terriglobales bacterium]|nr:hypothetical protein [Terriglobales bacterium]